MDTRGIRQLESGSELKKDLSSEEVRNPSLKFVVLFL